MDKTKSLSLIAEIFSKLNSVTFISKTCTEHPTCLPMYYCTGCFKKTKKSLC